MDFNLSPEEEAFRKEVEDFVSEHMRDDLRQTNGLIDTPERQEFVTKMADRGWLGMGFPAEYGGSGETMPLTRFLLNLELLKAQAPIVGKNLGVVCNVLMLHGSEDLKREFVTRTLRNEIQWTLAYTEPEAGSDLASMQCRAVLDGDHYVINGQKRFITSAHFANYMWTAVRTDPDAPKHKGISLIIIDMDAPGIEIQPISMVWGERTNEVFLDDVRVPKGRLVGEPNQGWYYLMEALNYERFMMASAEWSRREFKRLVEHVKTVEVDGKPLAADPVVRHKIARLAVMVEKANRLELRCICLAAGRPDYVPDNEAAMNKAMGALADFEVHNTALDILGADGYLWHDESAPLGGELAGGYMQAGHIKVAAAGVDIARDIIAKRYLKLPLK